MNNEFEPPLLGRRLWFPSPELAPSSGNWNGLVAIGGDLSVPRLLLAYRNGIFPWSVAPITWWSPDPRAIFELPEFHVSRSLARTLKKGPYAITFNRAFGEVMGGCAAPAPGRSSTWITPEFVRAYTELHRKGHAHSVECWINGELVGGIYGVAIGGFFSGESMFHRARDASKVALVYLVERLRSRGFALFDIQMLNPHTERLGAIQIPRAEFLRRLRNAVELPCAFSDSAGHPS